MTAAWLSAFLVGSAAPVSAEEPASPTTTTPGATILTVPPNETKILALEPAPAPAAAPTSTPTTAPRSTATTARATPTIRTTPTTTNAEVRADFATVAAAAKASAEERQRLSAEVAGLEPLLAATEAGLTAAQAQLAARQSDVEALEARVDRAGADVAQADALVARLELSAASAAAAVAGNRTPVARPLTPGHTPQDHAVQARGALDAALGRRNELRRALAGLEEELAVARQSTGGASSELDAKAAELQRGQDVLAELRRRLAAAADAAPGAVSASDPGRRVTLVPAPSTLAAATVPPDQLSLYGRAAATCAGLPWTILAAVGAVESSHGQSTAQGVRSGANFAGAMGPMQFLAGTWAAYGVDGDGDGVKDVYNATDSVFGAVNYLCASGAGNVDTLRRAVWNYNHADWYVDLVLQLAARY